MIPQKEGKEKSERSSSFSFSRAISRVSRLAPSIRRLYTASHRQSSDKADLYTESYVRSSLSVSPLRRIAIIDAAYNPDNRRVWLTTTKRRYRNNDFAFIAKPLRESSPRLDFRCNFIPQATHSWYTRELSAVRRRDGGAARRESRKNDLSLSTSMLRAY